MGHRVVDGDNGLQKVPRHVFRLNLLLSATVVGNPIAAYVSAPIAPYVGNPIAAYAGNPSGPKLNCTTRLHPRILRPAFFDDRSFYLDCNNTGIRDWRPVKNAVRFGRFSLIFARGLCQMVPSPRGSGFV
jgi:hypothetical protein